MKTVIFVFFSLLALNLLFAVGSLVSINRSSIQIHLLEGRCCSNFLK